MRPGNATRAQQRKLAEKYVPQPGINWQHELALQRWCQEMPSALEPDSGVVVAGSADVAGSVARDRRSAFILLRTLLETRGSFSILESWAAAAQVERSQKHSGDDCKTCLQTMASYEQFITRTLLEGGPIFRLQADGRKRVYQVEIAQVKNNVNDLMSDRTLANATAALKDQRRLAN